MDVTAWYTALDKTIAPLSNAGVYMAFIADIYGGENTGGDEWIFDLWDFKSS